MPPGSEARAATPAISIAAALVVAVGVFVIIAARASGPSAVDGSLGFTPRALRCVSESLASESGLAVAGRGNFCFVELRVENLGAVAFTYRSKHQRAMVEGRRYFPSDEGLRVTAGAPVRLDIAPGEKVDLMIVFDVPGPPTELELHDSARSPGARLDVTGLPEHADDD